MTVGSICLLSCSKDSESRGFPCLLVEQGILLDRCVGSLLGVPLPTLPGDLPSATGFPDGEPSLNCPRALIIAGTPPPAVGFL